jgi:hypothetical protein
MQNIINKIPIVTTIPLIFIALSGVANATECNISQITVLSDNCHKRAKIVAKAYPHKCLKEQLRDIFGGLF